MGEVAEDLVYQVVLVYEGLRPEELINAIKLHECSLILADLGSDSALRALSVHASCVIYDWRVVDFTGVGFIFARRCGELVPQLVFHDDRPGWEPELLKHEAGLMDMIVDVASSNVENTVSSFLRGIGVPLK